MKISIAQKTILQQISTGKELHCDNATCKIYFAGSQNAINLNTIAKLLQSGLIQIDTENSSNLFLHYELTEQGKKAIEEQQPTGADLVTQHVMNAPTPHRQHEDW